MADTTSETPREPKILRIEKPEDLNAAVEEAFDFRGDVTITLKNGDEIVGYVFNRQLAGPGEAYLEYFPRNEDDKRRLELKEIRQIALSGADPAEGRSWETWVKKVQEKKKAQAEGRDIGNIEPEVLPLDD